MPFIPDSKTKIPDRPPHFLARPLLRTLLDRSLGITLLCAPAGYGKTALLADWAHDSTVSTINLAWVRLDRADNDPVNLWSAVVAALAHSPATPPSSRLRAPWVWPNGGQSELLAQLLTELAALPGPVQLVLDDFHELLDPEPLHDVRRLLRDRPANVGITISSRRYPPLNLHTLRPTTPVRELSVDQLRFSRAEAAAFLAIAQPRLTSAQVDSLYRRTDGWPAALRLAALALTNHVDAGGTLETLERETDSHLAMISALIQGEIGELPVPGSARRAPSDEAVFAKPGVEALTRFTTGAVGLRADTAGPIARTELSTALALAQRHGFDYLALQCLTLLAASAGATGDFRAMSRSADEALKYAADHGWLSSPWAVGSTAFRAYAALLRAQPHVARRLASDGLALAANAPPRLRLALQVVHGAALSDAGERVVGLAELHRARSELGDCAVSPQELAEAAMLDFAAATRFGHYAAARTTHRWLEQRAGDCAEALVMRALLDVEADHRTDARATLRAVLSGKAPPLLPHTVAGAWVHEATLALLADERAAARQALHTSLVLAEPLDLLRPFANAPVEVRTLLAQQFGAIEASSPFTRRALAAHHGAAQRVEATLSERELAVLSLLPSLLSLEEIAGELSVSVNTIKSHVRSIYRKLGVSRRRGAVLTGYERGLITPLTTSDSGRDSGGRVLLGAR